MRSPCSDALSGYQRALEGYMSIDFISFIVQGGVGKNTVLGRGRDLLDCGVLCGIEMRMKNSLNKTVLI